MFTVSTGTRYAIQVLAFMQTDAKGAKKRYTCRGLSTELGLPYGQLRAVATKLAKAGILRSKRSRSGGICLDPANPDPTLRSIFESTGSLRYPDPSWPCVFEEWSDRRTMGSYRDPFYCGLMGIIAAFLDDHRVSDFVFGRFPGGRNGVQTCRSSYDVTG